MDQQGGNKRPPRFLNDSSPYKQLQIVRHGVVPPVECVCPCICVPVELCASSFCLLQYFLPMTHITALWLCLRARINDLARTNKDAHARPQSSHSFWTQICMNIMWSKNGVFKKPKSSSHSDSIQEHTPNGKCQILPASHSCFSYITLPTGVTVHPFPIITPCSHVNV